MIDHRAHADGNISSNRLDLKLIADMIPKGSRVLDIGCGTGELLNILVRDRNVSGHGLELSQSGVNACVARGLSVVQGDADKDLSYYPSSGFDFVILSQTLQATQRPQDVLEEMARIGKKLIISIPNFGHWRVRLDLLLRGRMPETKTLNSQWYNTANIHLCTLLDFVDLATLVGLKVDSHIMVHKNKIQQSKSQISALDNLRAELGVFVLSPTLS
ncbi:methionine biosynthesis protein MetW [Alphaproteobacteria bacterium]|nr:methionine biosynthesis protein MetW [Alphaproteobacteria bacterium]